jgi:hypothetical protein
MKTKLFTLIVLLTTVTLSAINRPTPVQASTFTVAAPEQLHTLVVAVVAPEVETSTSPMLLGSVHSNGSKASMFVPAEATRKVQHTNSKPATVTMFEDGSWIDSNGNTGCVAGELCNADSPATTFEDGSWIDENGNTGCMSWGICE